MAQELISKKYKGAPCDLQDLEGKLLATGQVEKISKDYLLIREAGQELPQFAATSQLQLTLTHRDLGPRRLVGRVSSSDATRVRLVSLAPVETYEHRRYFRVDVDLSANLYLMQSITSTPVRVRSLSLCGLMFVYDGELVEGDQVRVRLPFLGNVVPWVHCVVRRVFEYEGHPAYGCDILDSESLVTDGLCAFLFEKQQEQIRRRRGASRLRQ